MLGVAKPSIIMLSVVMLSVVMLSVVAPLKGPTHNLITPKTFESQERLFP